MHGLLTGRAILLDGPLDDIGTLIALPLAAAGARIVLAGPHDHNSRQLAFDIHRGGGTASSLEVEGSDVVTPAGTVDLTIKIWSADAYARSAAHRTMDAPTGRAETIIEASPSPDGGANPLPWVVRSPTTVPHAGADPTVTQASGARVGALTDVAGQVLVWAFNALLPAQATAIPTPARPGDILGDEEARADEDLNFELG